MMDGSHFAPYLRQEPEPEREWSLSAGQVTALVLVIVAVCELIGVLS